MCRCAWQVLAPTALILSVSLPLRALWQLVLLAAMSSSHDDSDEENPDAYPWNSDVMSDVYETFAKVVARCNGNPVHPNHPGRIQVKVWCKASSLGLLSARCQSAPSLHVERACPIHWFAADVVVHSAFQEVLLGDPLQALTKGASGKWHTIKKNVPVLCVGAGQAHDVCRACLGQCTPVHIHHPCSLQHVKVRCGQSGS